MEVNKIEVEAVVSVAAQRDESVLVLNDLELTLVGGGVGEVILA